jgi:thioredoxin-dependent peroxiredoxin
VNARNSLFAALMVLGLGLGLTISAFAADDMVPQVGQKAPQFALPSQDGSTISLSSLRGKWVVLYFYPKDMTPGCTIEAHNFQQDIDKYAKLNAVVVGVSVDSTGSHQQFCAQQGLQFKLLSDQDKKVAALYGSLGPAVAKRNTFLIDPHGKIVKVWTGVDPKVHSQEVLAALNTLQNKG